MRILLSWHATLFGFAAFAIGVIHTNYVLSIVIGACILLAAFGMLIFNPDSKFFYFIFALLLIFSLVSMDLGPFSSSTWSSETFGSGLINTPLTKFFFIYLALHITLVNKKNGTYIGFVMLAALIIIAEGSNLILIGTTLSAWSMLIVLFVLLSSLINGKNIFNDTELIYIVLRVSIYAIGMRIIFYMITNLLGYTDYLTFGQRPMVSSLYAISSILLRKKMGLIDFLMAVVNLIPIGKGDLIHLLIVAIILPRMVIVFLPIAVFSMLLYSNELILVKLAELASILDFDNISTLLGVELSSSDAGSIGTRVTELKIIMSSMITYPHSLIFGLNGIGITTMSVAGLGGNLTSFDYSAEEFKSGIIINVHGFYNKLLYTTGILGLFIYLLIVSIYAWQGYVLVKERLASRFKSIILGLAIGVALLFQLYLSPEFSVIYSYLMGVYFAGGNSRK